MNTLQVEENRSTRFLKEEQVQGVLFCWKIRSGLKKVVEIERIAKYADWFFENNLLPHFTLEEDFIFPLLKTNPELVKRAMADHRRLKRLFSHNADPERALSLIEEELEDYFRFENHKLIGEIQKIVSEKELSLIMKIYSESLSFEDWGDTFWK